MAVSSQRAFQSTFRVTLPDRQAEPIYHARRAHRKSRNGCLVCKGRRVKCDERKPACLRCENYGAQCIYAQSSSPPSSASGSSTPNSLTTSRSTPPNNTLASLSISDMVNQVRGALGNDLAFAPRAMGNPDAVLHLSVNCFRFMLTCSTETVFAAPHIQRVMQREMVHVAFDSTYLMYTIMGCGILHMNRLSPGSVNESRELAEAYFWERALRLYSSALQHPITEKNVSALISACMLIGVTSLAPANFEIKDSWVFTGRSSDLNWLAIQGGLACILKMAAQYVPGSIWGEPFSQSNAAESQLFHYEILKGREGLHEQLADLCGITDDTTEATSPYWYPIKLLTPYLALEANAQNAVQCTTWMGRIEPAFVNLCRERDPRALVILAYWMGLMCSVSRWQPWVEGRVRQECIAVCIYLESLGIEEVRPFLDFPAAAAGYTLLEAL
ncbi:Zn(II)2Cys6 transcription factor domain-containing protein [Aspergillus mulundensis]|uniref:Putative Zn(II)2Cys6 transcription factor n=1 Tax=Aspergillus mulundensis TaxID=1810919 RepID=A0A3D8SK06_9EURO|nr:putative Zn(II)2Cys6 transcription factor [Aspergillus mulundensis]RDW86108.1 putative Zn(II)2Cys6 transcription factor [Aspergillus mulundensis]